MLTGEEHLGDSVVDFQYSATTSISASVDASTTVSTTAYSTFSTTAFAIVVSHEKFKFLL